MSFNEAFNRIMKKKEAKAKRSKKAEPVLDMGDTETGRALATGPSLTADAGVSRNHSSWRIREFKQNPGAVKGRGPRGWVRKG
jgi:hypothetical protein